MILAGMGYHLDTWQFWAIIMLANTMGVVGYT
jgi:hypothetical protein